jgi:protein O-GlcNAc transferase
MMNPQVHFLLNKALESLGNSNLDSAELYLNQASKLQANNPHVLGLLGIVYAQRGNYPDALKFLKDSLRILPKNPLTLSNLGNVCASLKDFEKAIDFYKRSIKIDPNFVEAWLNAGNALQELKRFEEAIIHYDKSLALKPDYAEAWSNKGNALQELKRFEEAITHYDKALSLKPDYAEAWSNKGNALQELKRFEEAIAFFDNALNLKPNYAKGYASKGNALHELKRLEEAIAHHNKALLLNPNFAESYSCLGVTFTDLGRFEEALTHHDKALTINPDHAVGWFNKGITLTKLNRHNEAIICYGNALRINPDISWGLGELVHSKMKVCNWAGLSDSLAHISKNVMANLKVTNPFTLLSISDDPLLHRQAARIFSEDKFPENHALGPISRHSKKEEIRIAYFSPDFRSHPVSYLTAELFENHDRSQFEVFGFSLQKAPPEDPMSVRLKLAFDEFIEIDNLSDIETARLVRNLEVDIAIDLAGFTQHSRAGIFAYRAAPIQVNWLGYPGTTGAKFIDYIVGDKIVTPNSHQHFYSEKVAYLPNSYMVDDSKRIPSERVFTREECDLPKNSFIYCCLNNDFKFNPDVLDRWSRILLAAENSALWISENNKDFEKNIRAEFENRNIESSRIIFAKRVDSMGDYLARYRLADLFLDTYPYGAHTTAVDCLKAGVPVLTLMGQSFASRVASSLLNAIGLSELIAHSPEEYERLAIDLATLPKKMEAIKLKLANNLQNTPLFETSLFTKNLESIYLKMYERYKLGLHPDHLSLD